MSMTHAEVMLKGGGPIGNGTATFETKKVTINITKWILKDTARPDFLKAGKECIVQEGRQILKFKIVSVQGNTIKGDLLTPTIGANRG